MPHSRNRTSLSGLALCIYQYTTFNLFVVEPAPGGERVKLFTTLVK